MNTLSEGTILRGDAIDVLRTLDDRSVSTCVTSPPYWGLRDYGVDGQLGLERTPEDFVGKLVEVFREVHRILRDDGTLWLNLGDSYASRGLEGGDIEAKGMNAHQGRGRLNGHAVIKPKDLVGIPWRVAFALQADGWYLRQDIIWHKPNPMPESVKDRCTKAHDYIFLLTKSRKYHFDIDAIREPYGKNRREAGMARARRYGYDGKGSYQDWYSNRRERTTWPARAEDKLVKPNPRRILHPLGRSKRSVWTVAPKPYKGAHFATFPPDLIKPCILAGAPVGYTVLDPFLGSGTTAAVAKECGRRYIGIELNPEYIKLAEQRIVAAEPGPLAQAA